MTTPGSSKTPIPTSFISSKWPASSALKSSAWPTLTCSPTTTSPTPTPSTPHLAAAKKKSSEEGLNSLDFTPAQAAAARFTAAAQKAHAHQIAPSGDLVKLNLALRQTETALLTEAGLPNRPWYRHTIYAPGEFTGYAAVSIPGVNEAIDAKDAPRAAQQLAVLTQALDRAAHTLDSTP